MKFGNVSRRVSHDPRLRGLSAPLGAFVPCGASVPLGVDSAGRASVRSTAPGLALATGHQRNPQHSPQDKQYQLMARMAAVGGASGPYPAWDPV